MRVVSRCPACDSSRQQVVARLDEERRRRYLDFSARKYGGLLDSWLDSVEPIVCRCDDCGHAWYRNQPEQSDLNAMYAAGRPIGGIAVPPNRQPSASMHVEMARFFAVVRQPQPTLLDYGSGFGRWARAAVDAGFRVTAFEPSAPRGGEVGHPFELTHDIGEMSGRSFDAIQVEQVLEHVADPAAALSGLRAFCHPETIVRITVPNILRAPEGRALWRNWPFDGTSPHILAPFEHLQGFTPRSLRALVRRCGFTAIPHARYVRHYPIAVARDLLGGVLPPIGSTFLLIRPDAA